MKIGIIDADLIDRKSHRFPNLVCEKISNYWKGKGATVELITSYYDMVCEFSEYDQVYVSKVFTDTPIPVSLKPTERIHLGGTGFYFDKAPNLPDEIEHTMPDYHLYDSWVAKQVAKGAKPKSLDDYTDYSMGFLTRGCFRKCGFCVNKKYSHVVLHSPLEEFLDTSRKRINLLDDNFFGYLKWKELLLQVQETKKPFRFRQGLDERLLNEERAELLFASKYDGPFTFAFDSVKDYPVVASKLDIISKYKGKKVVKFYVLCGYESTGIEDIENIFKRLDLLFRYGCVPYLMRYQSASSAPWKSSDLAGVYTALAAWCNQPRVVNRMSFREFVEAKDKIGAKSPRVALDYVEEKYPETAKRWFDIKFSQLGTKGGDNNAER